ncbi:MAG TPA: hypothetical protein VGM67_18870 [Gemmatimonadaceae bacterium]|jgi:hypothetical protein
MAPKTAKGRVSDTRTYIEGYAGGGLPLNIRHDIGALITTRLPRTSRLERQRFDTLSADMSVASRIPNAAARGTAVEREQRRAIVLLWSVLASTQAYPAAVAPRIRRGMRLGTGALAAELENVMLKAAVVASVAGATHVFLTKFCANPLLFIQTHRIFVSGSTAGAAKYTGVPPVAADYRNVRTFHFFYSAEKDRFEFGPAAIGLHGASCQVLTVSVPAVHWSDIENRGVAPTPTLIAPAGYQDLRGVEMAGAVFMLTTQFTGCSFCYSSHGGSTYALHVSPAGITGRPVLTGQVLADQLAGVHAGAGIAGGVFSNWPGGAGAAPAFNVFGNGAGNAAVVGGNAFYPPKTPGAGAGQMSWMCIFGISTGGNWRIYSQSIDGAEAILEARRIF